MFLRDLELFLLESQKNTCNVLYTGDFNFWIDDCNDYYAKRFLQLLEDFGLKNFVEHSTHQSGHILDLVIGSEQCDIIKNMFVDPISIISDHKLISYQITQETDRNQYKLISYRLKNPQLSQIFLQKLHTEFKAENLSCQQHRSPCVDQANKQFRDISRHVYEKSCPLVKKNIRVTDSSKNWYNSDVAAAKRLMRKAEKKYKQNRSEANLANYRNSKNEKCRIVKLSKRAYITAKIENCGQNPKKLSLELSSLLGKNNSSCTLPVHTSKVDLANQFEEYFIEKIDNINNEFSNSPTSCYFTPELPVKSFDTFS